MNQSEVTKNIIEWATEKGIMSKATPYTQFGKLIEEVDELREGMREESPADIKDGIGDCVVVLTILADMYGMSIDDCVQSAYDIISKRTGKMVGGVFVKDGQ